MFYIFPIVVLFQLWINFLIICPNMLENDPCYLSHGGRPWLLTINMRGTSKADYQFLTYTKLISTLPLMITEFSHVIELFPCIIEGLCAKRVYIGFWADFHFLQDQANFWQTDLFWHEKHHSVIVFVDLRFILQK